ncbi:cytosolic carboxypeptidase 2 isoform X4 [Buteo buteo]|uniref:cytosolic carboxypeptidase 2 isoform X4 n=1 Tax=Buteo buteo TaxID=30397 RepID=UPI003EBC5ECE
MEGVQWGVVLGGIPTLPAWAPLISAGAVSWSRQRTRAPAAPPGPLAAPGLLEPAPSARRWGTPLPSARHRGSPGEPRALFALPSARGPLPAPRWPIECEVIKETIEHIEWVPPEPEPFCQPTGPHWAPAALGEEHGTVVYHLSPGSGERAAPRGAPLVSPGPHRRPSGLPPTAPRGSCFTRARIGGAPGPLSSPAAPLEGPQDTTLVFESRFESGNLQKAVKVGPYEYVLMLRPDLYTAKHTQWFYFRVQNTRRGPLYRFTIANMAKPKSLYGEGMRPLFYSQRDAQSRGIGWRRIGADVRYYRGSGGEKPAAFHLSWTARFPHDGDTCFFAHSYPYTYSDLQRYLWALAGDPVRSQYCAVRALCRSLAGNTVYLLTITSPTGAAAKRAVVLSARAHPGESGGSWAMRGFLDFLLSTDADAQLLRRLFVFKVVPMLNPDGVVVGNSRCSLAGRDPNRAYGTALCGSFPGVWHLRAMVKRVLAEREVVLYCDFHGHSRKNNVFMYGCDGGGAEAGLRLCQRVFPLMLSKNAPDKFSFPSCKFKVQKSKAGTGRVVMWRMGVSNSYTMEAAFGGSTLGEGPLPAGADGVGCVGGRAGWSPGLGSCRLFPFPLSSPGGRSSHFTVEDLKSLGYHLCDTLLDFCDPDPTKVGQQPRLKPRHPGRFWHCRWVVVTLAPSHSSSSACRRWMCCCGSGWAGSQALAAAGVTSPPRSLSPAGAREEEAAAESESEECPAPDKCCLLEPCQRPGEPGPTSMVHPVPEGEAGALQDPQAAGSPQHPDGRQCGGRGAQNRLQRDLSQRSQSRGWPPRCHGRISAGWWHKRGVAPSAAAEHPSPRCHR